MSWESVLKAEPFDSIKEDFRQWGREIRGKSGEALGTASGKTLYDMINSHGRVKSKHRGSAGGGTIGAYVVLQKFGQLMDKDLEREDADKLLKLIPYLKRMEEHPRSNPRNIPYTSPKRATGGKPSKEKYVEYGHYRTKHYKKIREELGKETVAPVPDDWYSNKRDDAKPPLWQALFAGGVRGVSSSPVVTKGLLTILEEYEEKLSKKPTGVQEKSIVYDLLEESANYRSGTNVLNYQKAKKFLEDRGVQNVTSRKVDNMILEMMKDKVKNYKTPNGGLLRLKTVGSAKAKKYGLRKSWESWLKW